MGMSPLGLEIAVDAQWDYVLSVRNSAMYELTIFLASAGENLSLKEGRTE